MHKSFTVIAAIALMLITGCDYARMSDQESLRPYEVKLPEMPANTVPVKNGIQALRESAPAQLRNPVALNRETIAAGRTRYGYYCSMCHGTKADGNGTVGQSFYPLPANLASPYVQGQKDGELFYKISLGFRRHPPLAYTVAEADRWLIINYIRSLGKGA